MIISEILSTHDELRKAKLKIEEHKLQKIRRSSQAAASPNPQMNKYLNKITENNSSNLRGTKNQVCMTNPNELSVEIF